MNKELQDLSWACLPKEARDEIRIHYQSYSCNIYTQALFEDIFGHDNLISGTEPSEYICVEKDLVLAHYDRAKRLKKDEDARWEFVGRQIEHTLLSIFGNKCLPDNSNVDTLANNVDSLDSNVASKLRFKEGDKVRVIAGHYKGETCEIYAVDESDDIVPYQSSLLDDEDSPVWLSDSDLEPYTEPSQNPAEICDNGNLNSNWDNLSQEIANCDNSNNNHPKDAMEAKEKQKEAKELNLCKLLKGCEVGETAYFTAFGEVVITLVKGDYIEVRLHYGNDSPIFTFNSKGQWSVGKESLSTLYPSRALYEKYPLDAYSAWMEWKEARERKYKLRTKIEYSSDGENWELAMHKTIDANSKNEIAQAADVVSWCLEKFHKDHTER